MKNNVKDYKGLTKEEEEYLREFDDAVERGFFKDKLVKIPEKIKKEINEERDEFKADITVRCRRSYLDSDEVVLDQKPYVGRKKTKSKRDKKGKFKKKEKNENR